jgi:phenylacetyl-CoA:acceptor oxidoreductase subunit 2
VSPAFSRLQTNWDARAALNFMCGGAGAGLMIFAALCRPEAAAGMILLALALVGSGLTAVWFELGKPLRALHVFFNPFTSWMARESYAAVLLFALAAGALLVPWLLPFAACAAAAFLWCQARMLKGGKGIPAWRARETVALLLATGLAEGGGLALLFVSDRLALAIFAAAVVLRMLAWRRHAAVVKSAALEPAGRTLVQLGTVVALALALAGVFYSPAAWLAGLAAVAAGWRVKLALVTRASHKQGFELAHVPVRGTR